jgi:hypothetical protein
MNPIDRVFEKVFLNRFQRILLLVSVTVWFLFIALSVQRNYQDSWILEGILWPFIGFIIVFGFVLWTEHDNKWVAILCSWTVVVILLIPSLKYKQLYGQSIDSVVHYRMVYDLMTTGNPTNNIYRAIAGVHSWLASMGLTSGLSAVDIVKLGMPLAGGILPLLYYWICQRIRLPRDITKYVLSLSCLATYPCQLLTGTGFSLVPLIMLFGILLVREYYCTSKSELFIYTILALIVLIQLTIWHPTTPLILLIILVSLSLTPVLVWLVTDRTKKVSINLRYLRMSLLAVILIIGYHTIEADLVFKVIFSRLYQLVIAENFSAAIIPASLFKLTFIEALKVYLVMYGREALLFILALFGLILIIHYRKFFNQLLSSYAYWSLIIFTFIAAIPLSFVGIDFRRLIWIPLAISPFFAGIVLWWWHQKWIRKGKYYQWLSKVVGLMLALVAVGIFMVEFYGYQPLVPKSNTLTPETPNEYVVWVHLVNTAYQQRMITFAETFSGPEMAFDIDVFGNRQYIRYYGGIGNRGLYLPLAPNMGWVDNRNTDAKTLFLLHWPGVAGGFGEQVKYRSVKNLAELRDTFGWGMIYDNGESFILNKP